MKKLILIVVGCILLCASSAIAQKPKTDEPNKKMAAAEKEVRQFFDSYAEDLRQHRPEAIADRYDRRGVYMMGNGRKNLSSFESVKTRYLTKWKGPKSFQWKDLSFEILSRDVVAVLGKFEWESSDGKVLSFSYTGLLVKRDGQWRIRVEDESSAL